MREALEEQLEHFTIIIDPRTGKGLIVIPDPQRLPVAGEYDVFERFPDGESLQTAGTVTLTKGTEMTITIVDPDFGEKYSSGTFDPETSKFVGDDPEFEITFSFWAMGQQIEAEGRVFSPEVGLGVNYEMTKIEED